MNYIEPCFAYTGSKYKLLPALQKYFIPAENFVDLFAGGGSVYSNVLNDYDTVYVNDIIKELIECHNLLSTGNTIIEEMKSYVVAKDDITGYALLRDKFNLSRNPAMLWALMLNCTNNMMRFNKQFKFNQTFGKRTISPKMEKRIEEFSKLLQANSDKLHFSNLHFNLFPILSDSLYYCDPPYSQTKSGYNRYWNKDDDTLLYDYLLKVDKVSNFVVSGVKEYNGETSILLEKLIQYGFKYDELECDYNKVSRKGNKQIIEIVCYN